MADPVQDYAHHRRFDPWYHFVAFALVLLALVLALVRLFRHGAVFPLAVALVLAILYLKVRTYALRVQDRLIRLEETLRMQALLDEPLRARIGELRPGQFVALRFASDAELPARVAEALKEGLGADPIKRRIQVWRADSFRV
jgi:hypothetical protein